MRRNSESLLSQKAMGPSESLPQQIGRVLFSNLCCYRSLTRRALKNILLLLAGAGLLFYLFFHRSDTGNGRHLSKFQRQFPDEESQKSAILISQQLERIESSLRSNRLMINDLRDEVNRFGAKIQGSNSAQQDSTSVFRAPQCAAPRGGPLPGDINMLEVYRNLSFDNPDGGTWKQGWPVTYKDEDFEGDENTLTVIVMPHSHNDPGWIKTFDTYFEKQTKQILSSAIDKLTQEPSMRFIWSELSYLTQWWDGANDGDKEKMKSLIKAGQIEITGGGWVMNDEANSYYFSILSQLMDGHEFVSDHFGVSPKYSWANDPFGLSPTMAYLFKKMGFKAMVIQRAHYSIKKHFAREKYLQFRWRQAFEGEEEQNDILCHLEPFYSYDVPHTCGPEPGVCCQFDFKRLPGSKVKCPWKTPPVAIHPGNVAEKAKLLLDQYRKKSTLYRTKTLLIPLGDDFRWDTAKEWNDQFGNYKKLFEHMNADENMNVNIKWGTLSDYFDALYKQAIVSNEARDTFPSLVGDFFTYADREDHYWSGYYTSKPFYKRFERILQSHLRASEILFSISNIVAGNGNQDPFSKKVIEDLQYARRNLALFQHHDAITGTSKDFVVRDYAQRMFNSFQKLENVFAQSLAKLGTGSENKAVPEVEFMHRFPNPGTPQVKKTFDSGLKNFFVLYNTLGQSRDSELVCFNIQTDSSKSWCLKDLSTNLHISDIQINHVWTGIGSFTENVREVCFQPILKQLSMKQFCVGNCECDRFAAEQMKSKETLTHLYNYHRNDESIVPSEKHILSYPENPANLTLSNDQFQLSFDPETGHLQSARFFSNGQWNDFNLRAQLMTYGTKAGPKTVPKSGAYLFLPDQRNPQPYKSPTKPNIRLINGPLESRIEILTQQPMLSELRFSLVRGRSSIDFETRFHMAGLYAANREFLVRFETGLENKEEFFTDLNGFQLIARKFYDKIPLQGNVYPFNTMAIVEDDSTRLNILTAQPLGVTVSVPGTMDIFLDRRLLQDDDRGVGQALVDNKFTHESFRIHVERIPSRLDPASPKPSHLPVAESLSLLNPVLGLVGKQSGSALLVGEQQYQMLRRELPCDIHLLNLRRFTLRPAEIGLLLHRWHYQCKCEDEFSFSLADLLGEQLLKKLNNVITPSSLTFLETTSGNVSIESPIAIEPSAIVAFKLYNRL